MHRTGRHGVDRRCMTEEEMTAKGMLMNATSFWVSKSNDRFNKEISDDTQAD